MTEQVGQTISFGQWLQHRMKVLLKIKPATISQATGVTTQTVYNWIRGDSVPNLDPSQYWSLCQTLGVKPFELAAAFEGKYEAIPLEEPDTNK